MRGQSVTIPFFITSKLTVRALRTGWIHMTWHVTGWHKNDSWIQLQNRTHCPASLLIRFPVCEIKSLDFDDDMTFIASIPIPNSSSYGPVQFGLRIVLKYGQPASQHESFSLEEIFSSNHKRITSYVSIKRAVAVATNFLLLVSQTGHPAYVTTEGKGGSGRVHRPVSGGHYYAKAI